MSSGVYRIQIGPNFYYGSSKNIPARRRRHLNHLATGRHYNQRLQRSWDKYGEWEFTVLVSCEQSELLQVEQGYLDQWFNDDRCMNLVATAGSPLGHRHSEETLAKMRKPKSPEQVAKMYGNTHGRKNKGRKATPEAIEANRLAHIGLKYPNRKSRSSS